MMDHTRTHKMANRMNVNPGLIKMIDTLMKRNVAARMAENNGLFELRDPMIRDTQEKKGPSGLIRRH